MHALAPFINPLPQQTKMTPTLNTAPAQTLSFRIKSYVSRLLMPSYLRRAVLMCSLAAALDNKHEHKDLAQRVCKELRLESTCDVNALLAPMHWSSYIWKDIPEIDLANSAKGKNLTLAVAKIYSRMPKTMAYGSARAMTDDIFATLRAINKVSKA